MRRVQGGVTLSNVLVEPSAVALFEITPLD